MSVNQARSPRTPTPSGTPQIEIHAFNWKIGLLIFWGFWTNFKLHEFEWNCQNFGLIPRSIFRLQYPFKKQLLKNKKKNVAGDWELKASRDQLSHQPWKSCSFRTSLFSLCAVCLSVASCTNFSTCSCQYRHCCGARVFLGETDLTVNYKGTHTIHGPPLCHEILEGKHEAFRKKGSKWEQEKTGITSGVQIEHTAEACANTWSTLFGSFLCRHFTTTISVKLPNFRT